MAFEKHSPITMQAKTSLEEDL
jgi:ribosome-binding factor A